MRTGVVLLAAGTGRRFGGSVPKQLLPFNGAPLFVASLKTFASTPSVREIVVVAPPGAVERLRRRLPAVRRVLVSIVEGGRFRGESVRNGVRALSSEVDVVLVHDAARPLVTRDIIRRVEAAARRTGSALAAWPLADTLKLARRNGRGERVRETVSRKNLWLAQTPQGFRRDVAAKVLLAPKPSATDDVALAEARGLPVEIVEGSPTNIKVTFARDLKICEAIRP